MLLIDRSEEGDVRRLIDGREENITQVPTFGAVYHFTNSTPPQEQASSYGGFSRWKPKLEVNWQVPPGAGNTLEVGVYTKDTGFLSFTFTRPGEA